MSALVCTTLISLSALDELNVFRNDDDSVITAEQVDELVEKYNSDYELKDIKMELSVDRKELQVLLYKR